MISAILSYLLIGVIAGFIAGLLGIGGGIIIVPTLLFSLLGLGLSEDVAMHLAVGTSLATIFFTSYSSMRTHHGRGYVRWDIVKHMVIGLLIGTFVGSQVAGHLSATPLKWIFMIVMLIVAIKILTEWAPKTTCQLPGLQGMTVVGIGIGVFSSFIGVGGAVISILFMGWCNVPTRQTIGTSAAIGIPVAFAGTVGNIISGWGHPALPVGSIGYIYLLPLVLIVIVSIPLAKVGARLAHHLSVTLLRKMFAILLLAMASWMGYSLYLF